MDGSQGSPAPTLRPLPWSLVWASVRVLLPIGLVVLLDFPQPRLKP